MPCGVKVSTITDKHEVSVQTFPKDDALTDTENLIKTIDKVLKD